MTGSGHAREPVRSRARSSTVVTGPSSQVRVCDTSVRDLRGPAGQAIGRPDRVDGPQEANSMHISEILKTKGADVVTVTPDATVRDLVALLVDKRIGAVVVLGDDGAVVGIVSERDVVRGLAD